jgi:hypothetical protein
MDCNIVERENEENRRRWREVQAKQDAERRERDLERARKLIAQCAPGLNDRDALAQAIADAFEKIRGEP